MDIFFNYINNRKYMKKYKGIVNLSCCIWLNRGHLVRIHINKIWWILFHGSRFTQNLCWIHLLILIFHCDPCPLFPFVPVLSWLNQNDEQNLQDDDGAAPSNSHHLFEGDLSNSLFWLRSESEVSGLVSYVRNWNEIDISCIYVSFKHCYKIYELNSI